MKRCKKEGAKLTGTIEVIMCLALKELYEKLNATEDEIARITYFTVISLRNQLEHAKVDEETLGLCASSLITGADMNDINHLTRNPHDLSQYFWPIAKKWSDKLHLRLKTDNTRFFSKSKPAAADEMNYQFVLSNIGDLGLTRFGYFDVLDVDCLSTFESDVAIRLFSANLITLKNGTRLDWMIVYNAHFVDSFIIGYFIDICSQIISCLCE